MSQHAGDKLVRKFKDEAVSVYRIEPETTDAGLKRYVVSTRDTRDLMNHPEIISCDFTTLMENGITNALKGINILEQLSAIPSKSVNVYHILRGGLNFRVRDALRKAFGYKWHSCSYISSQRVLKEGRFEIEEDTYRKFLIPNDATIYFADIVASGISLDNGIQYIDNYVERNGMELQNVIFITIGCVEAERVLAHWHGHFKKRFPGYRQTILIYLEGRFALAGDDTPLRNYLKDTDLLKNYLFGALLSPEFEYSQFDRMIVGLEGCTIYDGGKKGFEPVNHIRDILEFWEKQLATAEKNQLSLWDEYNQRFPLEPYLQGTEGLTTTRGDIWEGPDEGEFTKLHDKFARLWTDERIKAAQKPGSLAQVCRKKIRYLHSLVADSD